MLFFQKCPSRRVVDFFVYLVNVKISVRDVRFENLVDWVVLLEHIACAVQETFRLIDGEPETERELESRFFFGVIGRFVAADF